MATTHGKPAEPRDYAAFSLLWATLATGVLTLTDDEAPPAAELPVLGMAAFTVSKALAKEKIGAFVREPLVDAEAEPKGTGVRYVAGELLTCTRCLGTWSSLAVVGLRVARPREGRIVASVLAAAAVNDWLQTGFSLLRARAQDAGA